jgi:hypothetical protein
MAARLICAVPARPALLMVRAPPTYRLDPYRLATARLE